jgi:hypothetical protein
MKNQDRRDVMIRTKRTGLVLAALASVMAFAPFSGAQEARKQDSVKPQPMKQDDMQGGMKHGGLMHDGKAKTLATGKFHGKVHQTEGRATVYQEPDGKLLLRLTGFSTSNGPDVHVILVASKDAAADANLMKSNSERVELGTLKGNKGDQNYEIPAGTDFVKFTTVSIYCERFHANFGTAPLEKF